MELSKHNKIYPTFALIWPWITILLIFVNILLSPWFSWYRNALSDLGVNKYGYLFNGAIFSEGIINAVYFGIYGRRNYSLYLVLIASISLSLVGIFNENYHIIHLILALIYFILLPLYILINYKKFQRPARLANITLGLLAIAVIFIGILADFRLFPQVVGLAVYETGEAVLLSIWISYYIFENNLRNK